MAGLATGAKRLSPDRERERALLGNQPQLTEAGTQRLITEDEPLAAFNVYRFRLMQDNTLALDVQTNADTYTNEFEYLDDFARNLP